MTSQNKSTVLIFSNHASYFLFVMVDFGEVLPRRRTKPAVLSSPVHSTDSLKQFPPRAATTIQKLEQLESRWKMRGDQKSRVCSVIKGKETKEIFLLSSSSWWEVIGKVEPGSSYNLLLCYWFNHH